MPTFQPAAKTRASRASTTAKVLAIVLGVGLVASVLVNYGQILLDSPDDIVIHQPTSFTDESGTANFTMMGKRLSVQFVNESTGHPVPGLLAAMALDNETGAWGVVIAVDPAGQYPPQLAMIRGPPSQAGNAMVVRPGPMGAASVLRAAPPAEGAEADGPLVRATSGPWSVAETYPQPGLPPVDIDQPPMSSYFNIVDRAGDALFKSMLSAGFLTGYEGLTWGRQVSEVVSLEEAKKRLELLALKEKYEAVLLYFRGGATEQKRDAVFFSDFKILTNRLKLEKCARMGTDILWTTSYFLHFIECGPPARDRSLPDPDPGSHAVIRSKGPLPPGVGTDFLLVDSPNVVRCAGQELEAGECRILRGEALLRTGGPGYVPKLETAKIEVEELTVDLEPTLAPTVTARLVPDGATGFLKAGTRLQFRIEAQTSDGQAFACPSQSFGVISTLAGVVVVVDSLQGVFEAGPTAGVARVVARCGGYVTPAILVSSSGSEGTVPPSPSAESVNGCPSVYDGTYIGIFEADYKYYKPDPTAYTPPPPSSGSIAIRVTLKLECRGVAQSPDGPRASLLITHAIVSHPYFECTTGCEPKNAEDASTFVGPADPPTTPSNPSKRDEGLLLRFPNGAFIYTSGYNRDGEMFVGSGAGVISNSQALKDPSEAWGQLGDRENEQGEPIQLLDWHIKQTHGPEYIYTCCHSFKSWSLTKSAT